MVQCKIKTNWVEAVPDKIFLAEETSGVTCPAAVTQTYSVLPCRLGRLCRLLGLLIAVGSTSWEIFSSLIFIEKMTEGWASRQPIRYLFSFIFLERGKIPTISSVCSHLLSRGLQPVPVCGRPGRHIDSVLPSPASHEDTISSLALLTPASCHLALIGTFQIRSENLAAFIWMTSVNS